MLLEKTRSKTLSGKSMVNQLMNTASPDVIIRRSLEGIFLEVSDTVKITYGYDPKELIGKLSYDYIHPDDIGEFLLPFANGDMEIATFTYRIKNACGKYIWTETTVSVIKNPASNEPMEAISICRDISSRKKTVDQLIEAENLSLIGQLAAGLAHEIRNPLTTVKGFLQLLSSETVIKKEYLSLMQSEIVRIEQITQELMVLSKPSIYNKQHLNIIKIIEEVTLLLEVQAYKNKVQFLIKTICSSIEVFCDEKKIKQVFINLIKNGIEAMKSGGTLTINVSRDDLRKKVKIAIIDEGCGIPQSVLEQIGQPFFTTKNSGNGLGLMMSSKIIEEHMGHINVRSEVGTGTTFTVDLPT